MRFGTIAQKMKCRRQELGLTQQAVADLIHIPTHVKKSELMPGESYELVKPRKLQALKRVNDPNDSWVETNRPINRARYQQWECGINDMGITGFVEVCRVLKVVPGYFIPGFVSDAELTTQETNLLECYRNIPPAMQEAALRFMQTILENDPDH